MYIYYVYVSILIYNIDILFPLEAKKSEFAKQNPSSHRQFYHSEASKTELLDLIESETGRNGETAGGRNWDGSKIIPYSRGLYTHYKDSRHSRWDDHLTRYPP